MLRKYTKCAGLDVEGLMQIYAQSLTNQTWNAANLFLEDLQLFFESKGAYLALWSVHDTAVSAVRVEPYKDGYLLTCLETSVESRRRGYAGDLLTSIISDSAGAYYAHVKKKNTASLRLHEKCGFQIVSEHAVFVDGSVFTDSFTLKYEKNRC